MPGVTIKAKVPIGAQQSGVSRDPRVAARNRDAGPVSEAAAALHQPLASAGLERAGHGPPED